MIFTARNVALLIGSFTSVLSILSCVFIDSTPPIIYMMVGLSSFFSSYMIAYLLLEFVLFKEVKNVYQRIVHLEGDDRADLMNSVEGFQGMGNQLLKYSESKTKELKKMKEVESFRRQFLADIAHELKTPVHTAQGFVETLIDGAIDDLSVRDRFLSKTQRSLDNLNFIINDLINISHLETGEIKLDIEKVNVSDILVKVVQQLGQHAKKKQHNLILEIEKGVDFIVLIDGYRIEQVITNLVNNAINYSGEQKDITVKLSKLSVRECEVEIKDNGFGIKKADQQKVFNRFYRVDKSRSRASGGTGLGLAIVKHIIEAHNSEIHLQSEKNKGASFKFNLVFAH